MMPPNVMEAPPMLTREELLAMTPDELSRIQPEQVPMDVRRDVDLRHRLFRRESGIYSTPQAALYLGLGPGGIRNHIYDTRQLETGEKIGSSLVWTQEKLDRFEAHRQPPGFRRRKTDEEEGGK